MTQYRCSKGAGVRFLNALLSTKSDKRQNGEDDGEKMKDKKSETSRQIMRAGDGRSLCDEGNLRFASHKGSVPWI